MINLIYQRYKSVIDNRQVVKSTLLYHLNITKQISLVIFNFSIVNQVECISLKRFDTKSSRNFRRQ